MLRISPHWTSLALTTVVVLFALIRALAPAPSTAAGAPVSCDPARPHAAGDFNEAIDSGGLTREYLLHVPPSYSGGEAVPLVLNLHGLGSNASQQASYTGLPAKADEAGFLLVMPQGLASANIGVPHWNFTALEQFIDPTMADDVAYVSDLLDTLEAQICIDTSRVYSTGMSNGAMMSVRLACDLSNRIAAVAPVAGVYFPPWSNDLAAEPGCDTTRPVSVVAFHGTDDPIVLFEGGPLGLNFPFATRHVENAYLPEWAAHNGCDATPAGSQVSQNVRLVRYEGCDEGSEVQLYVVEGGGHTWPDSAGFLPEELLGVTTREINANDLIWEFFESRALPATQAPATAPAAQPTATVAALPTTGSAGDGGGTNVAIWAAVAAGAAIVASTGAWWLRKLVAGR